MGVMFSNCLYMAYQDNSESPEEFGRRMSYYYAHEEYPPSVRKLSDNFKTWLGEFLNYEEFERNDEVG